MTNTNTLTLRKCAYIFDSTYGNYFCGTKEQYAERAAAQKTLKGSYRGIRQELTRLSAEIRKQKVIPFEVVQTFHEMTKRKKVLEVRLWKKR